MSLRTARSSPPRPPPHARPESGQALVIMVIALVALMGIAGLVIDGGNAHGEHSAASRTAPTRPRRRAPWCSRSRLAGSPRAVPAAGTPACHAAINASAAANSVTDRAAYYTDICGIPLKADGTASLTGGGVYDFANAKVVGTGLPNPTSTTPDCPSYTVGPATGVLVQTKRDVPTYFARVIGHQHDARRGAHDRRRRVPPGVLRRHRQRVLRPAPDGDAGQPGVVRRQQQRRRHGRAVVVATGRTVYRVPLCKNGPGNVGWLDWTPAGRRHLRADRRGRRTRPTGPCRCPAGSTSRATGNPNASGLEAAIRAYDGQVVLVPQFDLTCNPGSNGDARQHGPGDQHRARTSAARRATSAATAPTSGTGSRRSPTSGCATATDPDCQAAGAPFGAYLNGNNTAVCDTGNGSTSCLVGKFESIVRTGTIGAGVGGGTGNSKAVGVQIIK